jgi:two-component system response regulator YesN
MDPVLKKILIVEDEPMIRHAIVETFTQMKDLTVFAAKNGKEGLETALHEHPDFILSDMVMPEMNGLEMLTELHKDPWGRDVSFVFLTNMDDAEKMAEARAKGVKDFILKSNMNVHEVSQKIHAKIFGTTEAPKA